MQPLGDQSPGADRSLTLTPESRTSTMPFLEFEFEYRTQGFHQGPPNRVLPARGLFHENLPDPMGTHEASVMISSSMAAG
jgi:hypothetical protein